MEKCEVCGKELKDLQGLAGHMRLVHPPNAPVSTQALVAMLQELRSDIAELARAWNAAIALMAKHFGELEVQQPTQRSNPKSKRWGWGSDNKAKPKTDDKPKPKPWGRK